MTHLVNLHVIVELFDELDAVRPAVVLGELGQLEGGGPLPGQHHQPGHPPGRNVPLRWVCITFSAGWQAVTCYL